MEKNKGMRYLTMKIIASMTIVILRFCHLRAITLMPTKAMVPRRMPSEMEAAIGIMKRVMKHGMLFV